MNYWEWSDPFEVRAQETALIIIDMQKGFAVESGSLFTPQAKEQLATIADLKKFCNARGIPVFMSIFAQDIDFHNDYYWARNKERGLVAADGSIGFKPGTPDCTMVDELSPIEGDRVFLKYTYSCFAHTELETWLKKKRIRTLVICGTCTNWCVDSTIRDAYHRDYNVVVPADCVSTYPHYGAQPDDWNNLELNLWGEAFAMVKRTAQEVKGLLEK